ncbi:hypothetical protein D3C85_864440 [compost metagenome]
MHLVGVLDHAEQALLLRLAVDVPAGVEDLVAAVLGVRLGEHHQLDVMGIAPHLDEALHQVVNLVFGERQTQLDVGLFQRGTAAAEDIDQGQRLGLGMAEQAGGLFHAGQHQLGHAVMQAAGHQLDVGLAELAAHVVGDAALETLDLGQATVAGDVGGLARPGRDGAEARHHQEHPAARLLNRHAGAVLEQTGQDLLLLASEHASHFGKVGELGIESADGGDLLGQLLEQFAVAKSGKGGSTAQDQHLRDSLWGRGVLGGRAF